MSFPDPASAGPTETPPLTTGSSMVRSLGVPSSVVADAVEELNSKLKRALA